MNGGIFRCWEQEQSPISLALSKSRYFQRREWGQSETGRRGYDAGYMTSTLVDGVEGTCPADERLKGFRAEYPYNFPYRNIILEI